MLPGLLLTQSLVIFIFLTDLGAGSTGSMVSIPLEKVKGQPSSKKFIPSVVVHQQHTNRGIGRLAQMKGELRPSNQYLWEKIANRLTGNSELICKLKNATGLLSDHPSRHGSKRMQRRHVFRDAHWSNSTTPTIALRPNSLGLEMESGGYGYIAKFAIGTPPQNYALLIDSGSADFWVGGQGCQSNGGQTCGNHTFLGSNSSSTFKDVHTPWYINYNTGAVSGTIVQDNITVANLHLQNFTFGIASNESSQFSSDSVSYDGLAGVAKSTLSRQGTKTLVESLHMSGAIKNTIISFKLPRATIGQNDGEITLGGMDPTKYVARTAVTVKNLNRLGFWEAAISQVKIDGKSTGWKNRTGVLDTGTVLLIVPQEDADAIHSQILGSKKIDGSWTVPCMTNTSLALTFGQIDFVIDHHDLAFIPVYDDEPQGDCWSGIGIGTVGPFNLPTTWLLGDVFLKNVYHSLDEDRDEITFARLK